MDKDSIKKTINAQKGHLTRHVNELDRAVTFLKSNPHDIQAADVMAKLDKMESYAEKIANNYEKLMEIDPEDDIYATRWETLKEEQAKHRQTAVQAILQSRTAAAQPIAQAPQQQRQQSASVKIQTALQPEKLQRDATPAALRSWSRKFKSFYNVSSMDKLDIADQQAFFFQSLDLNLETVLRQQIQEDTQIWGDNSCVSKLEEAFRVAYPLHTRRYDFHAYNQEKGQSFTDYYAKLRQKGDEADLANMTVDDSYVFKILMGVTDSELLKRLMKLKEPKLKDILKEGEDHEVFQRNQKLTAGPSMATVAAVSPQPLPQDQALSLYKSLKGKCMGCGKARHESRQQCPQFGKSCSKCSKPNHGSWCCLGPNFKAPRPPKKNDEQQGSKPTGQDGQAKQVLEEVFSVQCSAVNSPNRPTPKAKVKITSENGQQQFQFRATPDTGATRTVIAANLLRQHGMDHLIWKNKNIKLRAANGSQMKCLGNIVLSVQNCAGSPAAFVDAIVTTDLTDEMLISWHDLINLAILPPGWPEQAVEVVNVIATEIENGASKNSELDGKINELKKRYKDVLGTTLSEQRALAAPASEGEQA